MQHKIGNQGIYFDKGEAERTKSLAQQILVELDVLASTIAEQRLTNMVFSSSLNYTFSNIVNTVFQIAKYGGLKNMEDKQNFSSILDAELKEIKRCKAHLSDGDLEPKSAMEILRVNSNSISKQANSEMMKFRNFIMMLKLKDVLRDEELEESVKDSDLILEELKNNTDYIAKQAVISLSYLALSGVISNENYKNDVCTLLLSY